MISGIQGGKTTWGVWESTRMAFDGKKPGLGMICAPDYPLLSQATMRKFFEIVPRDLFTKWGGFYNKSERLVHFPDGNEILFRSADDPDGLRGPTLKWFWLDEITLCPKESWQVLQGRIAATGGRGIATGTPKASAMWVRDQEGKKNYEFVGFSSQENPGIDMSVLEGLADDWSEELIRQELGGEWVDWGVSVFSEEMVQAATADVTWKVPEAPQASRVYAMGVDPAGSGQDHTVCTVEDVTEEPFRVVVQERWQKAPFELLYATCERLASVYRPRTFLIDATGMGAPILEELINRVSKLQVTVEGFVFTAKSKMDLLQNLLVRFEKTKIKFPFINSLVSELRNYRWQDKGLATDTIMALALSEYGARHGSRLNIFV